MKAPLWAVAVLIGAFVEVVGIGWLWGRDVGRREGDRLARWSGEELTLIRVQMVDRQGRLWWCGPPLPGTAIEIARDCEAVTVAAR
jgi:hypothetical protein